MRPQKLLHVTLYGVGSYRRFPQDIAFAAEQIGASICVRPFKLTLDADMTFRNPRESKCFVICCADENELLMDLHQQIHDGLYEAGLPYKPSHLKAHMTLFYTAEAIPPGRLSNPVEWKVKELLLIHSIYGESKHNVVGRWPLLG